MRLQDYDITTQYQAKVYSTERITPENSTDEVRELTVDIQTANFHGQPGQSLGVIVPGATDFGLEQHFRLYSLADIPVPQSDGSVRVTICVRRCNYIDEFSGEEYRGIASNYLCDLSAGEILTVAGPYDPPFEIPDEPDAALILIGAGTGIAPFRALVKQIYEESMQFEGRILLFHGGGTGLELLYMNEKKNDFAQYFDRETFEAIAVLSQRPHWSDSIDWHGALQARSEELWTMLSNTKTYVYLAGIEKIRDELDLAFSKIAGSPEKWERRKAELEAGRRWVELLY